MTKAARHIGVVGTGVYLPTTHMTAKEVAAATGGRWAEADVVSKLGFTKKTIPGLDDGTQDMGVRAAKDCLRRTGVDPQELDLILCIGEEWKEYPQLPLGSIFRNRSAPAAPGRLMCNNAVAVAWRR
jgi:3-oxoacyl-[acyl-carrier-protein] synthase-3